MNQSYQWLMNYSNYSWNSLGMVHLELQVRELLGTFEAVEERAAAAAAAVVAAAALAAVAAAALAAVVKEIWCHCVDPGYSEGDL